MLLLWLLELSTLVVTIRIVDRAAELQIDFFIVLHSGPVPSGLGRFENRCDGLL